MDSSNPATIDKPEIKIAATEHETLACLSGPVDMDSSPAVRDKLVLLIKAADHKVISVDLSEVTHFDSSGIATLIDALRIARTSNTQLRLRGVHGRLLHLFRVIGILDLFNGSTERVQSGEGAI